MRKQVAILTVLFGLLPMTGSQAATCGTLTTTGDAQAQAQARPTVTLTVVVEVNGTVSNATIEKSSGVAEMDWAALDQARRLRMQPDRVDGQPVRSQKKITMGLKPPANGPAQAPKQAPPQDGAGTLNGYIPV